MSTIEVFVHDKPTNPEHRIGAQQGDIRLVGNHNIMRDLEMDLREIEVIPYKRFYVANDPTKRALYYRAQYKEQIDTYARKLDPTIPKGW